MEESYKHLFELPNYEDPRFKFEDLCNTIKNNIFIADKVFLPYSFKLSAHQMAMFHEYETRKFIFEQMPRGGAKTTSVARYIILRSLIKKTASIITAPTFRQSLLTFNTIIGILGENSTPDNHIKLMNEIEGNIVAGGMEARMRLKNGSVIKALPMGGGGEKIRGERADILYCDEFFKMDRDMLKTHLLPFLIKPSLLNADGTTKTESKLIVTTSAEYEDCFAYSFLINTILPKIEEELKLERTDPSYHRKYCVIDFNIDDLQALGFPLEPDIIALQISDASDEEKQRALYNRWVGISGQFFGKNLVEILERDNVHVETESDGIGTYVATADIAFSPDGDDFVLNTYKMIGQRKMCFVNSFIKKGLTQDEIAMVMTDFDMKFNYKWIYMDKGGGGYAVASSLSKRKIVLPDNSIHTIEMPITLHDESYLGGNRKLILNKPKDKLVREAFSGERSRSGEEISTEDILVHFTYTSIKNLINKDEPDVYIPKMASMVADDYARSEMSILENIRECIYQMRLLAVKTIPNQDGTREIVRSKTGKIPLYQWKKGKKDGAVAFCYSVVPYLLYYKEEFGEYIDPEPSVIVVPTDYTGRLSWLSDFPEPTPDQQYRHNF